MSRPFEAREERLHGGAVGNVQQGRVHLHAFRANGRGGALGEVRIQVSDSDSGPCLRQISGYS
jgi:hypothetical protein